MSSIDSRTDTLPDGTALAAFVSAGVGAFAMGLISLLNAIALLPVPTLYDPAGGVTGRTTLALLLWLASWVVLHVRWRHRDMDTRGPHALTIGLITIGILLALPPVWSMFG